MTESSKRVFREHAYKLLEFLDDPTVDERTLANQAAELAGVKPGSIHGALAYAKTKGNEWACAGEFQFKRAASSESSAKHPDLDGTSMPINPDRIQSVEKPTPAHIAAR